MSSAELAKEVFERVFGETYTFEGGTGTHLAYLLGAILCGSGVELCGDKEDQAEFYELVQDTFDEGHPVYKHIDFIPADDEGEDEVDAE